MHHYGLNLGMSAQADFGNRPRQRGFTLLELMVAVLIAGILAAIAIPSYRAYVLRTHRSVARNFLVNSASKEEAESARLQQSTSLSTCDELTTSNALPYTDYFYYTQTDADACPSLYGQYQDKASHKAKTVYLGTDGSVALSDDGSQIYKVGLEAPVGSDNNNSYLITATAINSQTADKDCTTMTLDAHGTKTPTPGSGSGSQACWSQ